MKRVAVIYGGWSSEREVSISSGTQMLRAAEAAGYDAVGMGGMPNPTMGGMVGGAMPNMDPSMAPPPMPMGPPPGY